MKFLQGVEKSHSFWFLVFASSLFIIFRFPSLFEPYWYGDEGVYQAVAILINNGVDLYSGAWDNKPPLLLLIYSFFKSDQFLIRSLSLIFGLISIWFFYFISKTLFKNSIAIISSTLIYAILFGTRILEGNVANAENFMLLPILAGIFLVLSSDKLKNSHKIIAFFSSGILISLAFLMKTVAAFDFLTILIFILIVPGLKLIEKLKIRLIPFIIGFSIFPLLTTIYFFFTDHFQQYLDALLFSNVGYVGIENELVIPQGFLIFKSILLFGFLILLFWKRNNINKNILFILIWFGFSLFNAFFSQRPYTHYLLTLLPAFCLLIGAIIEYKKERIYLFSISLLAFLLIAFIFDFKGELFKYYENYFSFILNKKSVTDYQAFFDRNTPRDYDLARYVMNNTNPEDSIYIWGNNAQIYKLADKKPISRYTVAYHNTGYDPEFNNLILSLDKEQPKLIIIMPDIPEKFPYSLENYIQKMIIGDAIIYEKIF